MRTTRRCAAALLVVVLGLLPACSTTGAPGDPVAVRVAGNRLVDQDGRTLQLRGVNRSGTQYACTTGPDTFDGPSDDASIEAMRSWGINAVRVSLNEQCWLGVNGLPVGGDARGHRREVTDYVDRLTAAGLVVILDLHWTAAGGEKARDQQEIADRDHAPRFWRSVAAAFAANRAVLYDLDNEPHPDAEDVTGPASEQAWTCVRDGGDCPGLGFPAAGMQQLVDAVRSTGAVNPILVAGPQFAGVVDRWTEFRPTDPLDQLVASVHVYGPAPDQTACSTRDCWDETIAPLAATVPVVVGEMGDMDCGGEVVEPLMSWADTHGVSYLAWAWVTSDCAREPALISDYDGTPTPYGAAVRDHLESVD